MFSDFNHRVLQLSRAYASSSLQDMVSAGTGRVFRIRVSIFMRRCDTRSGVNGTVALLILCSVQLCQPTSAHYRLGMCENIAGLPSRGSSTKEVNITRLPRHRRLDRTLGYISHLCAGTPVRCPTSLARSAWQVCKSGATHGFLDSHSML